MGGVGPYVVIFKQCQTCWKTYRIHRPMSIVREKRKKVAEVMCRKCRRLKYGPSSIQPRRDQNAPMQ